MAGPFHRVHYKTPKEHQPIPGAQRFRVPSLAPRRLLAIRKGSSQPEKAAEATRDPDLFLEGRDTDQPVEEDGSRSGPLVVRLPSRKGTLPKESPSINLTRSTSPRIMEGVMNTFNVYRVPGGLA